MDRLDLRTQTRPTMTVLDPLAALKGARFRRTTRENDNGTVQEIGSDRQGDQAAEVDAFSVDVDDPGDDVPEDSSAEADDLQLAKSTRRDQQGRFVEPSRAVRGEADRARENAVPTYRGQAQCVTEMAADSHGAIFDQILLHEHWAAEARRNTATLPSRFDAGSRGRLVPVPPAETHPTTAPADSEPHNDAAYPPRE
jgi:hypothetical protein